MMQLYFLSILCNGLAGYVLFFGDGGSEKLKLPVNNPTFYLVLGILSIVTGVLKLLSPLKIFFIGDLLPAAAGVIAGIMLIFGLYRRENALSVSGELDRIGSNLLDLRKPLGMGIFASAVAHFIFGDLLLL